MTELAAKLGIIRGIMARRGLGAMRLRGVDWFAWATCGGSSMVILTAETGIAEVLVTPTEAWVLTDAIEAERLAAEELPAALPVWSGPWTDLAAREAFVRSTSASGPLASDRPAAGEVPLPEALEEPVGHFSLKNSSATGSSGETPPRR